MIWILYNILFAIGFVFRLPKFLLRMWRRGGYSKDFLQRFGRYRPNVAEQLSRKGAIWIHAVSVGEVYVGLRVMHEIRQRRGDARFVLSVTTSTAYAIAEKQKESADTLIYFPLDFPLISRRVVKQIRPSLMVLIECEFWPNIIRALHRHGVPVALVNGRISISSFRGYQKVRVFTRRILPLIDPVCVQSPGDRDRLVALGTPPEHLHVMGSAKYEVAQPDSTGEEKVRGILRSIGIDEDRLILLGGSTWPGEEAVLLDIYRKLKERFPMLVLVLVPRHVERTPEVIQEIDRNGCSYVKRSEVNEADPPPGEIPDVVLVNTTGELKFFYACADVIFVGKSLTQHGGQNVIEPALYGKAIVVGPNMENFPVVMEDFNQAGALLQVSDGGEMADRIEELLAKPEARRDLGRRAARLVEDKRGAVKATVDLILEKNEESGRMGEWGSVEC